MGDQDIVAVFIDQGAAAIGADDIGEQRAQHATQGAGNGDAPQGKLLFEHQIAGEGHNDFRGQRDAGALNRHEQHHTAITQARNGRDNKTAEDKNNFFDHGLL